MTDDLTEIDGLGPARQEKLNDAGYETYADLAEADPGVLTEEIDRLPEDSALDIVVQAQNLADLEDSDIVEEPDVDEDEEEEVEEEEEKEADEDPVEEVESADEEVEEDTGPEEYVLELDVTAGMEYDTLFHTVFEQRATIERTNRAGGETYDRILDEVRATEPGGTVSVELTADEINDLHNAVLQQRIAYQGDNLIDHMDSLRQVENRLNDIREDFLF